MEINAVKLAAFCIWLLLTTSCVVETPVERADVVPAVQPEYEVTDLNWKTEQLPADGSSGSGGVYRITLEFKGRILTSGWAYKTAIIGPPVEIKTTTGQTVFERKTIQTKIQYVVPVFSQSEGEGERSFENKAAIDAPEWMVKNMEWRFGSPALEEYEDGIRRYIPFTPAEMGSK